MIFLDGIQNWLFHLWSLLFGLWYFHTNWRVLEVEDEVCKPTVVSEIDGDFAPECDQIACWYIPWLRSTAPVEMIMQPCLVSWRIDLVRIVAICLLWPYLNFPQYKFNARQYVQQLLSAHLLKLSHFTTKGSKCIWCCWRIRRETSLKVFNGWQFHD